jgi:hypothetical protein
MDFERKSRYGDEYHTEVDPVPLGSR